MKKLVIGFVIAVSLVVSGIAGTASATGPNDTACNQVGGTPAAPVLVGLDCDDHSQDNGPS